MTYLPKLVMPRSANNESFPLVPSVPAVEETYDTTVSSSTEITLNAATSFIEVSALSKGIFLKWGTADVSNSDFDEFIAPGQTRQYVVPADSTTNARYTAVNFIEEADSATLVLIEK